MPGFPQPGAVCPVFVRAIGANLSSRRPVVRATKKRFSVLLEALVDTPRMARRPLLLIDRDDGERAKRNVCAYHRPSTDGRKSMSRQVSEDTRLKKAQGTLSAAAAAVT